ncbi:hypothetical protein CHUAL_011263 [Chamberlinius hualienensis]
MMTSTQKQSRIVDYFNTKKRLTSINKNGTSLKLVDNVSFIETKKKDLLATEANISNNNLNDSPRLTNNLRSRKRRLFSGNEDSNVVKRICTSALITRQPILVFAYSPDPAVDNCELVLPSILDTFKTFDHLVGMLYNRMEMCFIDKLKPSVESVTRSVAASSQIMWRFSNYFEILKLCSGNLHLGQIVTVNPEAYNLRLEFKPTRSLFNKSGDQRHLTVNPMYSTM